MAQTITLRLDGDEISAQVFHQKVGAFLEVLHSIDRNVSGDLDTPATASVKWVVESIQSGSPVIMTVRARPLDIDVPEIVGEHVVAAAAAGLQAIESPVPLPDLPAYFTFPILEKLHTLTHGAQDGLTGITVSTPEQNIPLSKQADKNLERFLRPKFEHTGSVEGVLEMVSVARHRPRFNVRDRLSDRAIRCTAPGERLNDLLRVFGQRVSVFGRVRTNERGDVLSIHMEAVEAFPPDGELPSIRQVAGAFDLTGVKSIHEHLRGLRDAR